MSDGVIGILGGSGIYELPGVTDLQSKTVDTPFGSPSDDIRLGKLGNGEVAFLARHGSSHHLLPHEVNYRANIWALKSLGVEWIISLSAVGSMRESIHPGDVVIIDQFLDRTHGRDSSFFGQGLVAHVSLADPVSHELAEVLKQAADSVAVESGDFTVHFGGTYVTINGPQFSTRAESEFYRGAGVSVIGMTNMPEAKLAREAEISYATIALVTDYDCWHEDEAAVSAGSVIETLKRNAKKAQAIVAKAVSLVPSTRTCPAKDALKDAIMTPLDKIPEARSQHLAPLLRKYL